MKVFKNTGVCSGPCQIHAAPDGYSHGDDARDGNGHGDDADVDKAAGKCKQSEASAEALTYEEREHEFQKEVQLACACLRHVEC